MPNLLHCIRERSIGLDDDDDRPNRVVDFSATQQLASYAERMHGFINGRFSYSHFPSPSYINPWTPQAYQDITPISPLLSFLIKLSQAWIGRGERCGADLGFVTSHAPIISKAPSALRKYGAATLQNFSTEVSYIRQKFQRLQLHCLSMYEHVKDTITQVEHESFGIESPGGTKYIWVTSNAEIADDLAQCGALQMEEMLQRIYAVEEKFFTILEKLEQVADSERSKRIRKFDVGRLNLRVYTTSEPTEEKLDIRDAD